MLCLTTMQTKRKWNNLDEGFEPVVDVDALLKAVEWAERDLVHQLHGPRRLGKENDGKDKQGDGHKQRKATPLQPQSLIFRGRDDMQERRTSGRVRELVQECLRAPPRTVTHPVAIRHVRESRSPPRYNTIFLRYVLVRASAVPRG